MILCKKTYELSGLIFEKSKYYSINSKYHTYDTNGIVDSYFVYTSKKYGCRFVLSNYSGVCFPESPIFSDYFYTESELRNEKLKKLNKLCHSL